MTWLDSERVIVARAYLKDYDDARAQGRVADASHSLTQAITSLEAAQGALWGELKAAADAGAET